MSRKLRVAVVGMGIGRNHLDAYKTLSDLYDIAAVCDLDANKGAAAQKDYGARLATPDFDGLLTSGQVDVVDICTPPNTHRELVEKALQAGLHVICEKPLTGSLAAADAISRVAATAKGTLSPIFQYRYGNGLQKLKHLQSLGLCGKPYLTTIETSWRRGADYYDVPWRGKWASELGGCCLTHAIHAHDILSYVNGPIKNVFARAATRVNTIEVEDVAAISVEMANGSLAVFT